MKNVINLQVERENKELIDRLGRLVSTDKQKRRLTSALKGKPDMKNSEAIMISVRLPQSLVEGIDDAAREIAYREKRKVTRSSLVTEWLDASYQAYLRERDDVKEPT